MTRIREIEVPEAGDGLRLDRFLAQRFRGWSRTALARGIQAGLVTDAAGRPLRRSRRVRAGDVLHVAIPGIAPDTPPPPLSPILHEDDRVVVLDKPAGLACHPGGAGWAWAVVGLARSRWPGADLVHRLDKETSGVLVLTKDRQANAFLKAAFREGGARKTYVGLLRGAVCFEGVIDAPIGRAGGPIRIQMAVREGGLPARTSVRTGEIRHGGGRTLTWVECVLHTGRTHQIRVHLAHVAAGLVGDRLYGVPPEVFLDYYAEGITPSVVARAGAPRHALHARTIRFPHPDGGAVEVAAPLPDDLARWWADPSVLPFDQESQPTAHAAAKATTESP